MSGRFPVPWRAVATPSMNIFNAHCLKSSITELRSHKVSWQIQPRHSRYLGHRRRKDSPQRIGGADLSVRRPASSALLIPSVVRQMAVT